MVLGVGLVACGEDLCLGLAAPILMQQAASATDAMTSVAWKQVQWGSAAGS